MKKVITILVALALNANSFILAQSLLWAKSVGNNFNDEACSVTTDASGNVFITGYFYGSTITFGSTTLTNAGNLDIFIAKYDAVGNLLWAKSVGGTSNDYSQCVSADASGNVFITGFFNSPTITFGSTTLNNVGFANIFIAKYDASGNVVWAKSAVGGTSDYASSVSTDANGNAIISGYFNSPNITFGSTNLTNQGGSDIFIAKYDASGNVLWAKSFGGTYDDYGRSVSSDTNGNIYMSGFFTSPTISFGSTVMTNAGSTNIFIVKYVAAGNLLWAKSVGTGGTCGNNISVDASGNVYMSGGFTGANITIGSTTLTNVNNAGNSQDIFITKYDVNGNLMWAKSTGGISDDFGNSVSNDASGNVFVSGYFRSPTVAFGSTTLTNVNNAGNSQDIFIAKYDAAGNVLWAKSSGGTGDDNGRSIITNASGNVYITGQFQSPTITFGSTALTNADTTGNSTDIFIANYSGTETGVEEMIGNKELDIYPNPAGSSITLSFPSYKNNIITITNLTGKQVDSFNLQNATFKTIDVSQLAEGVYFVTLKSDEGVVTKKMVKTN